MGFIGWVKGVMNKLFGRNEIAKALGVQMALTDTMSASIDRWAAMYRNTPPWAGKDLRVMGLPSAIASELARLTTIEFKSQITGSARADFLNEQYAPVLDKLRNTVEYAAALGGIVLKPCVAGGAIVVDVIQADRFYPTLFDASGNMTGCIFVDQFVDGNKTFTRLEHHQMTGEACQITNKAYVCDQVSGKAISLGREVALGTVERWKDVEPIAIIQDIPRPLFAYFKMPMANIVDEQNPLGVSVYARAEGLIEEADRQYTRLLWEFESGERALYVDESAFRRDANGNRVLPKSRLYRALHIPDAKDKLFEDWTPTLREQNIINGLNRQLMLIEDECGFSRGTFSDVNIEARTATEVKMLRQRTYALVADTQRSLQRALEQLIYAMNTWCTLSNLAPPGAYQTAFEFDDSTITDRQAEFAERMQLVTAGILSKAEFYAWYFGVSEDEAAKRIPQQETDLFAALRGE